MSTDRNFVAKNGLTVNTNLIFANGTNSRVGIMTATPDATLAVNGTANVSGAVAFANTLAVAGDATFVKNVSCAWIVSTNPIAQANNAAYLGGVAAALYSTHAYSDAGDGVAYSNAMADTLSRSGTYTGNNTFGGTNTVFTSNAFGGNLTLSGLLTISSNTVTIGTAGKWLANGNFGVGILTPAVKMDVYGTGANASLTADTGIFKIGGTITQELTFGEHTATPFAFWMQTKKNTNDGTTYPLSLNPLGGNIGIGKVNPGVALDVNGAITASSDITSNSDRFYKKDIVEIQNALEKVKQLIGVTFQRDGEDYRSAGLIAQDVEKVLPEAVRTNTDGKLTLAYFSVLGLIVEAIKDLDKKVDRLSK
jgi:hypothetical protein